MQLSETPLQRSKAGFMQSIWITSVRRSPIIYPLAGLVAVLVAMSVSTDAFLSTSNLANLLVQVSNTALIAVGMTFVIATGGIDLSVGAVLALCETTAALLMSQGINGVLALFVSVIVGVFFGFINGFCVARLRMPPIIVTLATMGIARGLALILTGGYPVDGLAPWVAWLGTGNVFGVQTPIVIMLIVYALGWIVLERMPFGRYVFSIGGNELASRLSGIRVGRYKQWVYIISGLTTAIAGVVLAGRLMSGQPSAGDGDELDAIAAVVLGGTSIAGGRGSLIGTLIGSILLGALNNGLNMVGVSPYVQTVVKGGIILLAIYIGRERAR